MKYTDWQQRVIDEHDELEKKYNKLREFMKTATFTNLMVYDKKLLCDQELNMGGYLHALKCRIERFEDTTVPEKSNDDT